MRLEPGRGAVKISLSTSDEATARARWMFVHAQVEGLVQQAKTTANSKTQRESATAQVERLAPDVIFVQAVTSEQREALLGATIVDREETEIDKRLAENGLVLADNHPDRRRLALALLRADANACEVIRLRGNGAGIETPPRPAVLTPKRAREPAAAEEPTLWAMRERWLANKKPGTKQADDNLLYIRGFISLPGDLPVTKISGRMIDDYLALLNRCCRNVPNAIRAGSLQDRVAWSERRENIDKPRLTRRTINAKGLGAIGAALKEAERLGLIARNPCAGMALDTSKTVSTLAEVLAEGATSNRSAAPSRADRHGPPQPQAASEACPKGGRRGSHRLTLGRPGVAVPAMESPRPPERVARERSEGLMAVATALMAAQLLESSTAGA